MGREATESKTSHLVLERQPRFGLRNRHQMADSFVVIKFLLLVGRQRAGVGFLRKFRHLLHVGIRKLPGL